MNMLTRIIVTSLTLVPLIAPSTGYGQVHRGVPDATEVRSGGRVIGRDPDPFIRGQLLRSDSLGYK
jgi:hypothetical protein